MNVLYTQDTHQQMLLCLASCTFLLRLAPTDNLGPGLTPKKYTGMNTRHERPTE
jgi:hypothetical protein